MPRLSGGPAVALITLTAIVLAVTGISGYVRAEFTGREEFAHRVGSAVDEPAVRVLLAERVVDGITPLVAADALAVRPLLVAAVEALARTEPFRRVVLELARRRHGALVDGDGGVVFNLAARGGVLLDAVRSISPRTAEAIPRGIQLPILTLRPHGFETLVVDWISRIAGWWWPLLAASGLMAAACAALAGGVRNAIGRLGLAAAGAGLAVALAVSGLGSFVVAHAADATGLDSDAEHDALAALWSALFGDLRTAGLVVALGGVVAAALASGALALQRMDAVSAWTWRGVRSRRPAVAVSRTVLLTVLGLALLLAPSVTGRALAVLAGAALATTGIARLAGRLSAGAEGSAPPPRATATLGGAMVLTLAMTAVAVALVVPAPHDRGTALRSIPGGACNGSVALCHRPLDDVMFAATHNSFAAANQRGWFFANQRHGIRRQLADGIRGLLIDVHYGVRDADRGRVRTDLPYEGSSRNKVVRQLGPEAVRTADRLAGRVGVAPIRGPRRVFLCHTLCELGAEPIGAELDVLRRFLDEHPRDVVIVFVEPYVPVEEIERAFREARLLPAVATLGRDEPLPTLGDLVDAGTRLVVLAEDDGGTRPWYLPGFSFVQDTPLGARRPGELSCDRARGDADSPLLLVNHWIDTFPPSVSRNQAIGRSFLRRRLARCERERGLLPNLVAVDFYEKTDVVRIAERFNAGSR
jgi:hypothetical protein